MPTCTQTSGGTEMAHTDGHKYMVCTKCRGHFRADRLPTGDCQPAGLAITGDKKHRWEPCSAND